MHPNGCWVEATQHLVHCRDVGTAACASESKGCVPAGGRARAMGATISKEECLWSGAVWQACARPRPTLTRAGESFIGAGARGCWKGPRFFGR